MEADMARPEIPSGAFSVAEFCKAHGDMSIGFFYVLQKRGEGPRTMKIGTRTMISLEEASRWRAEYTAKSSAA
jgi:hypothetical protein